MILTNQTKHQPRWATIIKQYRTRKKLTQTQLGALFGVSHAAVSDWERNITNPPGEVTWFFYKLGGK